MNRRWLKTTAAFGAIACLGVANGPGGPEESSSFKLATPQKFELVLPVLAPTKLAAGPGGAWMIPIPHAGGTGFAVELDGVALSIDTDGDGKADAKVKGIGGVVTLKGKTADGKAFAHSVRLSKEGLDWFVAPAGYMLGKVAGVDVKLIDLNVNGRFDEAGVDAMVVGKTEAGSLVSKVANLGGKLYTLVIDADGTSVVASPYEGAAGTLNLAKGFKTDGAELVSAVVASADDSSSFEVSDAKAGMLLPVGDYKLVYGFVKKGSETVKIKAGTGMKPFKVEAETTNVVAWGGPVEMDFTFSISKDTITVPPDLRYTGAAGEEYFEFKPDAKSPQIVVFDPASKTVVREGRFGGC